MEYVDGQTLREIVKTPGPMSQQRVIEVMADVCAALDFSHKHSIIHRDVKPANIMINRAGAVKVMDFGIARALGEGQNMTQTAAVIGTAQYLSPEQARGEAVDARSDVYAAGCVLFELLTGEPPFTGDTPVAVAYQHVREDPRSPSEVNPSVTPQLDAIVLKALSKNPVNRYQSAAEMRADLVRVRSGQQPLAPVVMSEDERTALLDPAPPGTPAGSTAPAPARAGRRAAGPLRRPRLRRLRRGARPRPGASVAIHRGVRGARADRAHRPTSSTAARRRRSRWRCPTSPASSPRRRGRRCRRRTCWSRSTGCPRPWTRRTAWWAPTRPRAPRSRSAAPSSSRSATGRTRPPCRR